MGKPFFVNLRGKKICKPCVLASDCLFSFGHQKIQLPIQTPKGTLCIARIMLLLPFSISHFFFAYGLFTRTRDYSITVYHFYGLLPLR